MYSVGNLQISTTPYITLWNINVKKRSQSEICIVINDKSQSSIAKHLRNDELLYYTFVTQSAGERIFKTSERLMKLQAKWWLFSALNSHCIFVLKDADLAR